MRLFVQDCHIFLRGERKFTATPCRNFSLAMRLEGCKDFFELVYDFPRCSQGSIVQLFFCKCKMQMQIFSECVRWGGAVI